MPDKYSDLSFVPPKTAQKNARKVLKWKEKYPDEIKGGTRVGWTRARQLSKGQELSRDVISRMAQFKRHQRNAKVANENKGTPWQDAGRVAWLLWGGTSGVTWANALMERIKARDKNE